LLGHRGELSVIEMFFLAAVALSQPEPADDFVTCIKTTIDAAGKTSRSKVIVSSGDRKHDQGALQFLKALNFSRVRMGLELGQSGHILVRQTEPGVYTVDVTERRLLEACPRKQAAGE
jgi:hypothetical protein